MSKRPSDWDAPVGRTWVCLACGKHSLKRDEVGDESCFMNAELFDTDKLVLQDGRVIEVRP